MKPQFSLLICLATLLMVGCNSLRDTAEPPAELTEIQKEVRFVKQWQRDIGEGSGDFLRVLQPVITEDTLYTSDAYGKITAFDKQTGKKRWRAKLKTRVSGALGDSQESLFLGTQEGELVALSKENGRELWRVSLTGEILSRPVSDLGVIVVQTVDGAISGISENTGEVLWTNRRSVPPLSLRGTGQPVLHRGLVVTGMDNGRLLGLSLLEGRVVWETPLGLARGRNEIERISDADIRPLINEGVVFGASYQGRLVASAIDSGRILWTRDMSAYHGVAVDDYGSLYISDEHSQIWSMDKRTGATLWKQDKLRARSLVRPSVLEEFVISADFEGFVHVLHSSDGRLVGRKQYNDEGYVLPPIIDGDTVYVLDESGELTAFQLKRIATTS